MTKSQNPIFTKYLFANSPSPNAPTPAPNAGSTHKIARTVPLMAQAHQNAANVRIAENHKAVNPRPTTPLKAVEKEVPSSASAMLETTPMQMALLITPTNSFANQSERTDTGKVRCHECVPDIRSSPSGRLPARRATRVA